MKVICISGKAGAGKDTFAQMVSGMLTDEMYSVAITHYADALKNVCKTFFNWNGEKDERGRELLQIVGTEFRNKNENTWVEFIANVLDTFKTAWDYVLIPDLRYDNEWTVLMEKGYDVLKVRIERNGYDNGLTEEQKKHSSEVNADSIQADIIIENNGDEESLFDKAADFVSELVGGCDSCSIELEE